MHDDTSSVPNCFSSAAQHQDIAEKVGFSTDTENELENSTETKDSHKQCVKMEVKEHIRRLCLPPDKLGKQWYSFGQLDLGACRSFVEK
jgi:hypothetical protein